MLDSHGIQSLGEALVHGPSDEPRARFRIERSPSPRLLPSVLRFVRRAPSDCVLNHSDEPRPRSSRSRKGLLHEGSLGGQAGEAAVKATGHGHRLIRLGLSPVYVALRAFKSGKDDRMAQAGVRSLGRRRSPPFEPRPCGRT